MELIAAVKRVEETKTVGSNGFEVRSLIVSTEEQYSQTLDVKFTQGKVSLLDGLTVGQRIKIAVNLKGREVTKPDGTLVVYNTIEGWKIEKLQ